MKMLILLTATVSCLHVSGYLFPQKQSVAVETVSTSPNSEFSFLRAHRQAKGIMVTWGMSTTEQVQNFRIESTVEDPSDPYSNWTEEGNIPAENGSSFKFMDNTAYPGYNNYRIVAVMNDNSTITSTVCTVRIVSH